jgi:toxin-antitoxin system PIN domain toxin
VFVVDTNVLVYAADEDSEFHTKCLESLSEWRGQTSPWHLTWGIAYEFLRVVTHPRVFRRPWSAAEAWGFLDALLESPSVSMLIEGERHATIAADLIRQVPTLRGNILHDAHTVALMREHGIRVIYTRDTDFHRFAAVDVRDPA